MSKRTQYIKKNINKKYNDQNRGLAKHREMTECLDICVLRDVKQGKY